MHWILLVYKVPADPSRHRVSVWRAIRRIGAISLQQSICALPDTKPNRRHLIKLAATIDGLGGEVFLIEGQGIDRATRERLEGLYSASIEAELKEFIAECAKFDDEIAHEFEIEKFTHAELAEEEESLERLERWLTGLSAKDLFGAPSRAKAEHALKESSARLEQYAQRVFSEDPAV